MKKIVELEKDEIVEAITKYIEEKTKDRVDFNEHISFIDYEGIEHFCAYAQVTMFPDVIE